MAYIYVYIYIRYRFLASSQPLPDLKTFISYLLVRRTQWHSPRKDLGPCVH